QGGAVSGAVPEVGVGAAEQVPAAGGDARVDARVAVRDRDRAGGHGGAGRRAAGEGERVGLAREVGETRGEAGEGGGPALVGVGGDDLGDGEAEGLGYLGEVLAVVDGGDLDSASGEGVAGLELQGRKPP